MQGHFRPWSKRAGWFGSAVGKIRSIKCWLHIFSGSFGSAVDQRTKYKLFSLSVGFIYLLARLARLARQCM